jgi:chloramphenicol O-acetyltransferase type A
MRHIDLDTWSRADQFRFFRGFDRPHYAITARVDVSRLKASGLPLFRTSLWCIGAGLHAVPALRTRFQGDVVTEYDTLDLSPTIAVGDDFRYTYMRWSADRSTFDTMSRDAIDALGAGAPLGANDGQTKQDVAYLSCVPWLDYTALDNAMPDTDDCIPRVGWGKIVPKGDGFDMAMTLQVHHALVDGRQVSRFFEATQARFDAL